MQKRPELITTGLVPPEEPKEGSSVHVFGMNVQDRVVEKSDSDLSLSFNNIPNKRSNEDEEEDNIESIRKRKFEAITGEEDECTAFQGDFKLFVWDLSTSNWLEKGRGQLKLNDPANDCQDKRSRLIMRVNGTLRIILNVAIQPPFFRIIASTKNNIRFTDSQNVWAAGGSYASQLNVLIEERLKRAKQDIINEDINSDTTKKDKKDDTNEEIKRDRTRQIEKEPKKVEDVNENITITARKDHRDSKSTSNEDVEENTREEETKESTQEESSQEQNPQVTTTDEDVKQHSRTDSGVDDKVEPKEQEDYEEEKDVKKDKQNEIRDNADESEQEKSSESSPQKRIESESKSKENEV